MPESPKNNFEGLYELLELAKQHPDLKISNPRVTFYKKWFIMVEATYADLEDPSIAHNQTIKLGEIN